MSNAMFSGSVPVFTQYLTALSRNLDKAAATCAAKNVDPAVLLNSRLALDMFPLIRQVQIACDFAKGCAARLAGVEVPSWPDNEATVDDLKARIKKTIDFIGQFKPQQFEQAADRPVEFKVRGNTLKFKGSNYLTNFAMGHFMFHCATAYNIMRHAGVEIGKSDFIGQVPEH